jgi:3-isopropylmalate/(R)-2-methylmalate dehydratase small subunit
MVRGTFANTRLHNEMTPDRRGGFTGHYPSNTVMTVFEAAQRYAQEGVPLVVVAGREYGTGSSRDWAAKGPKLLGVRAVIAPSYGDIFATNSVKNGLLPVVLPEAVVQGLIAATEADPNAQITVDLPSQTVTGPDGAVHHFEIDPFNKRCLLEALDELAFTLTHAEDIAAFERRIGRENF